MNDLISTDFTHVGLAVADAETLLTRMAGALRAGGRVRDTYRDALVQREAEFPTGLPVGCGVAIPHADAAHVLVDTIAIATLAQPVVFGEMGGDGDVPVRVVFMLALTASGNHLKVLQRIVTAIQDGAFLDAVTHAGSASEAADVVRAVLATAQA